MVARRFYLVLCIVGTVLPLLPLARFLRENGLDPGLFIAQLFGTPVSAFFAMDVIVSSLALWVLVVVEGRRHGVRHLWAPIAANLLAGVSSGLPLFLYMRELRLSSNAMSGRSGA